MAGRGIVILPQLRKQSLDAQIETAESELHQALQIVIHYVVCVFDVIVQLSSGCVCFMFLQSYFSESSAYSSESSVCCVHNVYAEGNMYTCVSCKI